LELYQLALLGDPPPELQAEICGLLETAVRALGMTLGDEVSLHMGNAPFVPVEKLTAGVLYFGKQNATEHQSLKSLLVKRVPVIPVASTPANFSVEVPAGLHATNGVFIANANAERLTTILLESVGLLPRQRRIFVSYKRDESRDAALQLYEALAARLFEVFLDTHGIVEGAQFQEELWHKLSDCDVVVMLDTPHYFASRWTRAEFARALAKSLAILRVGWPGHEIDKRARLARDLPLAADDFRPGGLLFTDAAIQRIALALESSRTTSIATRYRNLVGAVEQGIGQIGGSVTGIGVGRKINLELPDGRAASAYPALGIPTSPMMQEAIADQDGTVAIVYDHLGVRPQWLSHMAWLGTHISKVRWVKGTEAAWAFADWEEA
jgi:hypothetical protein